MENRQYNYDVAFSFLKEDENLAVQLNDLIQDRYKTFIYSKKQETIAGTDGEKTFNDVFGKEARVVVVLYRKHWGEKGWTRIEETAIRNRAFDEGYDFTIFIPLDKPLSIPKYLPRTQIYVGIERWGIKGAASVIDAKIQSSGGEPREETPDDVAARLRRDQLFEAERTGILNSDKGVELARQEALNLFSELEKIKNNIEEKTEGFSLGFKKKDLECFVQYQGHSIKFLWQPVYYNSLMESKLYYTTKVSSRSYDPPQILEEIKYHFDISKSKKYGWIEGTNRDSFVSSEMLAQGSVKALLERAKKETERKNREKYI